MRRCGIAFRTLLLSVLTNPAWAACQLGAVAVLPVRIVHGAAIITVDVNEKPANLILDTGAFATILKRSSAERLGVSMAETGSDSYGVGGVRHIYRGRARHMRVGTMKADGMVLGGSDILETGSNAGSDAAGPDGLFGMNMMAAYDIDLDFIGGHAIIFEADGECRKPAVALSPPLYDVRLVQIDHNRQADVDIDVDGHPIRAEIDSGAARTVMFRDAAYRLGLDLGGLHAPGHHESHGTGPLVVASMTHVFSHVRIGDLTINNMPIEIIDQPTIFKKRVPIGSLLADNADGEAGGEGMLIGADFMQKVHLWISHSSQRLIMQYPPQPSELPK